MRRQPRQEPTNAAPGPTRMEALRGYARDGLPMPLWLQGALEFLQCAILSALAVMVPVLAVWFTHGFEDRPLDSVLRLCGQAWLLIHGVPLALTTPGETSAEAVAGTLSLTPLGLTLIPFVLAWRSGRRIARASYTDQLWQGIAGALLAYALFGLVVGSAARTADVGISLPAAALVPLVAAGLGVIVGTRREAGSWGRLIGVDVAARIARTSQSSRWTGSYLWSVVRAGAVAYGAAFVLSSVVLAVNLGLHWADIANVYQQLKSGPVGGSVLTLGQLGMLPNFAVWALAWISGGGFSLGTGSTISTLQTTVGPLPAVPVLAALPVEVSGNAWLFLLLPVLAGFTAGWWFLREGENHFDDWIENRIRLRWLSMAVSTVLAGLFIGAVAALLSAAAGWLSQGSLGIGRLVDLGPDLWATASMLMAEVAVGVVLGYLVAPAFERDPVLEG